jgi:HlyD family secretion protein
VTTLPASPSSRSPAAGADPRPAPRTSARGVVAGGLALALVGFGGLGAWAGLAPLHGAVLAQGRLVPESGRKTVKHPEGGLVGEVLAKDGDAVVAGQVLLRLDPVAASSRFEALTGEIRALRAQEARLAAELAQADAVAWPDELAAVAADPGVARMLADHQGILSARRAQREAARALLAERVAALGAEAGNVEEQRVFLGRELALLREEIATTGALAARGHAPRNRLLEQRKDEARLEARDRELAARLAQVRQQALEAEVELGRREDERREAALAELDETRRTLSRLLEERREAENRLRNRDVTAPETGVLVGLGSRAPGTYVGPGEAIADVVPAGRPLLAEIEVEPRDIRDVAPGLPVHVSLTAFDTRVVGTIRGTVVHVSADLVTDPATRRAAYLVRASLDLEGAELPAGVRLVPGMPAEAQILMSARTPLDYLLGPIEGAYRKAFVQR